MMVIFIVFFLFETLAFFDLFICVCTVFGGFNSIFFCFCSIDILQQSVFCFMFYKWTRTGPMRGVSNSGWAMG